MRPPARSARRPALALYPVGLGRFRHWVWRDAEGETKLRPRIIAALDATATTPPDATCAGPRPLVQLPGTSRPIEKLRKDLRRLDLVDADNRLTERGLVIRFHYRRYAAVRRGLADPFGIIIPDDEVPW